MVTATLCHVTTYGQRFREARQRLELNQEQARDLLKFKRQSNVSAIETSKRVPGLKTILKHARLLGCQPSELLAGVVTEYDRIKAGVYDQPPSNTDDPGPRRTPATPAISLPGRLASVPAEVADKAAAERAEQMHVVKTGKPQIQRKLMRDRRSKSQ